MSEATVQDVVVPPAVQPVLDFTAATIKEANDAISRLGVLADPNMRTSRYNEFEKESDLPEIVSMREKIEKARENLKKMEEILSNKVVEIVDAEIESNASMTKEEAAAIVREKVGAAEQGIAFVRKIDERFVSLLPEFKGGKKKSASNNDGTVTRIKDVRIFAEDGTPVEAEVNGKKVSTVSVLSKAINVPNDQIVAAYVAAIAPTAPKDVPVGTRTTFAVGDHKVTFEKLETTGGRNASHA